MKNLFQTMMLVAAAAMGITACTKETAEAFGNDTVQATETITLSTDITRTALNPVHTQLIWSAGDRFAVYTDKGAHNSPVTYTEGAANFELEVAAGSQTVYAYYPYYERQNTQSDQTAVSLYVTSTQKQTEAGVFDGDMNDYVMVAKGEIDADKHVALTFKPAACALALNIYGGEAEEAVKKVTFDPGVVCAGQHYMDLTAENPLYTAADGQATSVTVEMGTPFAAEGAKPAAGDYSRQVYAVVARKSYAGATFTVETDKTTYTFTTTSTLDLTTDFYTLNLNLAKGTKPEPGTIQTYTLVSSLSDLNTSDTYIIAGNNQQTFDSSSTMYVWDGSVNSSNKTRLNCIQTTAEGTAITILPAQKIEEIQLVSASDTEYYIKVGNQYLSASNTALSISSDKKNAWIIKNDWKESGKDGFYLQTTGCYVFCNSASTTAIRAYSSSTQYKGIYFFRKGDSSVDPDKKTLTIDSFTATLNADKTAVSFAGSYTSNYDEEPQWTLTVSKDGTEIGSVVEVIGVEGEIAADNYAVTEDGTYTFTLTATIGGEVVASKTAKDIYVSNNSSWTLDTFTNYSVSSNTYDKSGTFMSSASANITWSYTKCGNTSQATTDKNSLKSGLTVSNDATYIAIGKGGTLSTTIPGGITNLKFNVLTSSKAILTITITCNGQTVKTETVAKNSKTTKEITDIDCLGQDAVIKFSTSENRATIGDVAWK